MNDPFRVLDLFSGIGGFSLGLERTGGFRTVAFCEIEPYCRAVLAKHWPDVPCYEDVRDLTADRLRADGIVVDVICGGFPCQDISLAGNGAGLDGARSGLWSEIARLSGELRPRYLIVENVAALLHRGLDRVLGDLAAIGYDTEWHSIPASALGAPHRRDRVWLVAYPEGDLRRTFGNAFADPSDGPGIDVADADGTGLEGRDSDGLRERSGQWAARPGGSPVADAARFRWGENVFLVDSAARGGASAGQPAGSHSQPDGHWLAEPDVGRVAHGVPQRVDRLRALGNAVVPQIPEMIGRAILEAENA